MKKKESGKRRKDEHNPSKKSKDKKVGFQYRAFKF
jgi:hypothetical protein